MDLSSKVMLVKMFRLEPAQIIFLSNLNITFNFDKKNVEDLTESILDILNGKLEEFLTIGDEEKCLYLAYIIANMEYNDVIFNQNKQEILLTSNSIFTKKEEQDNEEEDGFFDEIGGLTAKDKRKIQREAVAKYKSIEQLNIVINFKKFLINKYPQIINGFDVSIYSSAKTEYWNKEHLFDLWEIPTKLYEKIKAAEREVEASIREDIITNSELMYPIWFEKYKIWLQKNGLKKSTKLNVKDFFKTLKVKPTETIVERIKENYTN